MKLNSGSNSVKHAEKMMWHRHHYHWCPMTFQKDLALISFISMGKSTSSPSAKKSNFWEVVRLHKTTAQSVINKLKQHFGRYGIPDVIISDNGPPFSSRDFDDFIRQWESTTTPSPHTTVRQMERQSNQPRKCWRNALLLVKMKIWLYSTYATHQPKELIPVQYRDFWDGEQRQSYQHLNVFFNSKDLRANMRWSNYGWIKKDKPNTTTPQLKIFLHSHKETLCGWNLPTRWRSLEKSSSPTQIRWAILWNPALWQALPT